MTAIPTITEVQKKILRLLWHELKLDLAKLTNHIQAVRAQTYKVETLSYYEANRLITRLIRVAYVPKEGPDARNRNDAS